MFEFGTFFIVCAGFGVATSFMFLVFTEAMDDEDHDDK